MPQIAGRARRHAPAAQLLTLCRQFHKAYADLARSEKVALVPFLLEGIADQPRLFQSDTIHPTAEAQPQLLDNVWWVALAPPLK